MKEGFKLAKASKIDITKDCFWELYTSANDCDPRYKGLIIEDRDPYFGFNDDVKFEQILKKYLDNNSFFHFDYKPKFGDMIFLNFNFESICFHYTFSYFDYKSTWNIPIIRDKIYCIDKSVSGIILNPMALLLEWA